MEAIDQKKLALLVAEAFALGIKEITIEFAGSGDSGQIDTVCVSNPEGAGISNEMQEFITNNQEELEHCGYAMMENTSVDFNNDGSSGSQVINCQTGKVEMDYQVFYMESRDESAQYDVGIILNEE